MKRWNFRGGMLILGMLLLLTGCSSKSKMPEMTGQIYLYGEAHGNEQILEREYELWEDYYTNHGMRHLFIEWSYFSAELLNVWMQEEDDEIIEIIFDNASEALGYGSSTMDFYKKIKANCPETIFHGTDVGHQYDTTGTLYLEYLSNIGLTDSEQYELAEEAIQQGKIFYEDLGEITINKAIFRENKLVENFAREYEKLNGEDVMGIYGSTHVYLDSLNYSGEIANMATQLSETYVDKVHSEDLQWWLKDIEPERTEIVHINEKEYEISFFGIFEADPAYFPNYKYIEFGRIENAYEDFKTCEASGDMLAVGFYPMNVEPSHVYVLDYTLHDGTKVRQYHYYRGLKVRTDSMTEEFWIE